MLSKPWTVVPLFAVLLSSALFAAEGVVRRPNILLILADDLGYECLGVNGGTSYKTPRLDALAASGIRFTHCYTAPVCTPSRLELMTGRYGFRTGQQWGVLPKGETTFAQMLKSAGYATAVAGKWQLCKFQEEPDHPRRSGFDEHCLWTWRWNGKKPSRYWAPSIWQDGKLLAGVEEKYGPDIFCDFLIDFIRRPRSRPFFAYFPMTLVHAPFVRPPAIGGGGTVPPNERGKDASRNFAAMVAYMDHLVGRLLDVLDERGLRESTLVLFSGDNGTPRKITSLFRGQKFPGGKGRMTDAGTHVPLIASWPGTVPRGIVCDDLVDFTDFVPTLVDLTGAKLPDGVPIDGGSFAPQLRGKRGRARPWVYTEWQGARCVRERRWKLYGDGRLFDLDKDPLETQPLARGAGGDEARAARARLQVALSGLRAPAKRGKAP